MTAPGAYQEAGDVEREQVAVAVVLVEDQPCGAGVALVHDANDVAVRLGTLAWSSRFREHLRFR